MKTYDYAHEAAKEIHKALDRNKPFEYWGDPEEYLERGLIVRKPKRNTSGYEYYPITDDLWYVFDDKGIQRHGPFETKREALGFIGEESAHYVDSGLYEKDDRYIARRGVAIEYEFKVYPKAEVTNG